MNSNVTITLNNLRIRSSALTVELANGATFDLDGKDGRDWGL
jgi:hypothetical protein